MEKFGEDPITIDQLMRLTCMQDTFARATHSAGRPSAARDDRVSCIQAPYFTYKEKGFNSTTRLHRGL